MKRQIHLARVAALCAFLAGTLRADPQVEDLPPQAQISFTVGSGGTWNADWESNGPHRVFFLQYSLDLQTWHFAPLMRFGTGLKSVGCSVTHPRFFIRLVYYDDSSIESLEQAMNADFDNDGVSNFDEISALGTNPLVFATGGGSVGDGDQDWDGDGISNADEVALGLDPGVNNTNGAAGAATVGFSFDDVGRLVGVTSPVAVISYNLDPEGNIN